MADAPSPALPPIQIRGARQNNLRHLDVDLPRGALIVLTGPSGSGKTSLAVDVLHAEGQRRLVAALGAGRLLDLSRPDVDLIGHLPPTVGVLQHHTVTARATVGSLTEVGPLLRALAANHGVPRCPICDDPLPTQPAPHIAAALAALPEGTALTLLAPVRRQQTGDLGPVLDEIHRLGFARVRIDGEQHHLDEAPRPDPDQPHDLEVVVDRVRVQPDRAARIFEAVQAALAAGSGRLLALTSASAVPVGYADHPYCFRDDRSFPPVSARLLAPAPEGGGCPDCAGLGCDTCGQTGLGPLARRHTLGTHRLGDLLTQPLSETHAHLQTLPAWPGSEPLRAELARRLDILIDLGLGHLPLARHAAALSSGERGRARLAGQTGHPLSGVLFILDEPSEGLADTDLPPLLAHLRRLQAEGNTVLVVDHHPALLAAADHHLRFGPGAGRDGGLLLYAGPPEPQPPRPRPATAAARVPSAGLRLAGARGHNLRDLTVTFPRAAWTAVCGPSGCGKSSLVSGTLAPALAGAAEGLPHAGLSGAAGLTRVLHLDRRPAGRNARSCVASAVGVWGHVRALLASTRGAKIRGYGAERFSFNRPGGRCEACQGTGARVLKLDYLPDATVVCEVCGGRRFDAATLAVEYRGATVHDILAQSVDEARQLFANQPRISRFLGALSEVGLGYMPLGQTADTFSGGEGQRVRLASELARAPTARLDDTVALLDEPASALHADDAQVIAEALRRLVGRGATVVTVAYQPALLLAADHLIVMGDGAGPAGGRIVAQGPPAQASADAAEKA